MLQRMSISICGLMLLVGPVFAKSTRDAQVRGDRKDFLGLEKWIYNDLPKGLAEAKKTGRPLLIVFR